MSAKVVYEIAHFDGERDDALLLERMQLLSVDGGLRFRDAGHIEIRCKEADIVSAISSRAPLREIRAGEHARISCDPEIAARLPLVLKPVLDGHASECSLVVNGETWSAYSTPDDEYVVLPGDWCGSEPEMSPCWARYAFEEEGGWNEIPLAGRMAIGLATPAVVVEYARYDYGWGNEGFVVAIEPFKDFPGVFVDWLETGGPRLLDERWVGNAAPCSPGIQLFAEAAAAADGTSRWSTETGGKIADEDDHDEDDHDEEILDEETGAAYVFVDTGDEEEEEASGWARAYLELHLSDELIGEVQARLGARK
mgnify:CR=1 FL=1